MSQSSGHGISSGDLNTGGNLSESSFLEAHLLPITIYWKKIIMSDFAVFC